MVKDITCIICEKSDYHENPGPYFSITFRGWFCSIACWMKHSELLPRPKGRGFPLLPRCCAVIALWHRGTFCGNFRFPHHHEGLAYPGTLHSALFRGKKSSSTQGHFTGCSLPRVARLSPRNGPYQAQIRQVAL